MENYKTIDLMIDDLLPLKNGFVILWSASIGYGNVEVRNTKSGIIIDSETMSKEFVKALFDVLIDKAIIK